MLDLVTCLGICRCCSDSRLFWLSALLIRGLPSAAFLFETKSLAHRTPDFNTSIADIARHHTRRHGPRRSRNARRRGCSSDGPHVRPKHEPWAQYTLKMVFSSYRGMCYTRGCSPRRRFAGFLAHTCGTCNIPTSSQASKSG